MKIKYVFFDCWDTVVHYQTKTPHSELKIVYDHIKDTKGYSFEQFCLDKDAFMKDYYLNTVFDVRIEALLKYLIESKGLELDCSYHEASNDMVKGYEDKLIDGLKDFVAFISSKGSKCSILSNTVLTYEQTKYVIDTAWPHNPFEIILASSDFAVKKPDPRFFKLGAFKVNVKPEECIFIGDNINTDIAGAYNAGMMPFYFNWKKHTPTAESLQKAKKFVEFSSYKELQDILSKGGDYEF